MFYSHEVLTDRKHGVATVWLVATLGSKSALKKITRKSILNVDVPKTCGTITEPTAPLALRLQGSLLYGVSRVFSQQCGYMLNDVQGLRDRMRCIAFVVKEIATNPDVANTRPEQLNISEDTTFDIDLDMSFDLSTFAPFDNLPVPSSSQTLSSIGVDDGRISGSSLQESFQNENDILNFDDDDLNLKTQNGGEAPENFENTASEEQGIVQQPEFEISEDGSLRMLAPNFPPDVSVVPAVLEQDVTERNSKEANRSGKVTTDPEVDLAVHSGIEKNDVREVDFPENDSILPSAEPFSPTHIAATISVHEPLAASGLNTAGEAPEEIIVGVEASQRRAPRNKAVEIDSPTELANRYLNDWNKGYLTNMKMFKNTQTSKVSLAQAKRNASFWVLDQGLGGVSLNFGTDVEPHPFAAFSGQSLLSSLTGGAYSASNKKRPSSDSEETEEDTGEKRVKLHAAEEEVGRGYDYGQIVTEQGDIVLGEDDIPESEIGRAAPPSLRDQSSEMPWNVSSRQGSLFSHGNIFAGGSSAGRLSSAEFGPSITTRRMGQRLTSASPLLGKGGFSSRLESLSSLGTSDLEKNEEEGFTNLDAELAGNIDEAFELYGPAAAVSTQQAMNSQWLAVTLENEAKNFLSFLVTAVLEKTGGDALPQILQDSSTTFEELLHPKENSDVVAAQGFLHVLTLATKNLILVDQPEAYGNITINVATSLTESISKEAKLGDEEEEEDAEDDEL